MAGNVNKCGYYYPKLSRCPFVVYIIQNGGKIQAFVIIIIQNGEKRLKKPVVIIIQNGGKRPKHIIQNDRKMFYAYLSKLR